MEHNEKDLVKNIWTKVILSFFIFTIISCNTINQKSKFENVDELYINSSNVLLKYIEKRDYNSVISNLDGKNKGTSAIESSIDKAANLIEQFGMPQNNQLILNKRTIGPDNNIITLTYYFPSINDTNADRIQFYYFYDTSNYNPEPVYINVFKHNTEKEFLKYFIDP